VAPHRWSGSRAPLWTTSRDGPRRAEGHRRTHGAVGRLRAELEAATPKGFNIYRVIVGPNGEVFDPASGWVVDVNVFTDA
jgi:hypothetical protein